MLGRTHIVTNTASLAIISVDCLTISEKAQTPIVKEVADDCIAAFTQYFGIDFHMQIAAIVLGFVFFYLGTLLPDIDTEKSLLGRIFHLPIEHRTWTHAVWFPLLFVVIGFWFAPFWWLAFGYVLHLFFDSLSRGGICWLYPFRRYIGFDSGAKVAKGHRIKLYSTGEISEYIVAGIVVFIAVITVVVYAIG